jgi:bacterial/archaeal transporter family protein
VNWLGYALLSAVAAGATAILAKLGVQGFPAGIATAVRTSVVFLFVWATVIVRGESPLLGQLTWRSSFFLLTSGVATGVSWLAYFKALQLAPASRVAPIDKLSLPITVLLAFILLGETLSARLVLGVCLMVIGSVLTLRG